MQMRFCPSGPTRFTPHGCVGVAPARPQLLCLFFRAAPLSSRSSPFPSSIGGSGCGKSTLLRLIAGLDQPTRGKIMLDGERITAPHPAVGFVFHESRLLPWLTVAQNAEFRSRRCARTGTQ